MTKSIEHHLSKDGSSTLYSTQYNQFYHNPNGAVSESKHVFFESPKLVQRLSQEKDHFSIFEVGFGTGLNYLLLLDYYQKLNLNCRIDFYSVEAYPADISTIEACNYDQILTSTTQKEHLVQIFNSLSPGWNSFSSHTNLPVTLHIYFGKFEEMPTPNHAINFFFHDPFSPEVNEELWNVSTFKTLRSYASEDASLSTYCAASKARAHMAAAGWKLCRAPGALGKREMTIAAINAEQLPIEFKRLNEDRLIERLQNQEF